MYRSHNLLSVLCMGITKHYNGYSWYANTGVYYHDGCRYSGSKWVPEHQQPRSWPNCELSLIRMCNLYIWQCHKANHIREKSRGHQTVGIFVLLAITSHLSNDAFWNLYVCLWDFWPLLLQRYNYMIIITGDRVHILAVHSTMCLIWWGTAWYNRVDFRFAPGQWETLLHINGVSHWLGSNLESALHSASVIIMDAVVCHETGVEVRCCHDRFHCTRCLSVSVSTRLILLCSDKKTIWNFLSQLTIVRERFFILIWIFSRKIVQEW